MEGCLSVAKDKAGDVGNAKSQDRVRGKQRCVVERGDLEDRGDARSVGDGGDLLDSGDARSGWESRPRSLLRTALRRPSGPFHLKVRKFPCIESLTGLIVDKFASSHGNMVAW